MTKKIIAGLAIFALAISFAFALSAPVFAASSDNLLFGGYQQNVQQTLNLGNEDPRVIAASIVRIVLGFLGIIAVVLIMFGGFRWMTAAGNEDGITEAKGIIASGIIGLVIILASWGMAEFIIGALFNATNAG